MSDLFPNAPTLVSLERQIKGVEREVGFRERVYSRRITEGKMTREKADEEIAVMKAVGATLAKHAELKGFVGLIARMTTSDVAADDADYDEALDRLIAKARELSA